MKLCNAYRLAQKKSIFRLRNAFRKLIAAKKNFLKRNIFSSNNVQVKLFSNFKNFEIFKV